MEARFETFTRQITSIYRSIQKIKSVEMTSFGLKGVHVLCTYFLSAYKRTALRYVRWGQRSDIACGFRFERKGIRHRNAARLNQEIPQYHYPDRFRARSCKVWNGKDLRRFGKRRLRTFGREEKKFLRESDSDL